MLIRTVVLTLDADTYCSLNAKRAYACHDNGLFSTFLVSKGIVDAHGGLLSVYSAGEGRGSTFTIELPMESPTVSNVQSLPDSTPTASTPAIVSWPTRIRTICFRTQTRVSHNDNTPAGGNLLWSFHSLCCYPLWNRILPSTWNNIPEPIHQSFKEVRNDSNLIEGPIELQLLTTSAKNSVNINQEHDKAQNSLNSIPYDRSHPSKGYDEKETERDDRLAVSLLLSPNAPNTAVIVDRSTSQRFPSLKNSFHVGRAINHTSTVVNSRRTHTVTSVTADVRIEDELSFRSAGNSPRNEHITTDPLVNEQSRPHMQTFPNSDPEYSNNTGIEDRNHHAYVGCDGIFKYKKVLIVDDVAMNRKMLRRVLESRFDIVEEAGDGQEAVDMVRAAQIHGGDALYDVITMDYQMPVMDGVTATRILRDLGYDGAIVAVTGNAFPADVQRFILSGANEVFIKPLDLKKFDTFLTVFHSRTRSLRGGH